MVKAKRAKRSFSEMIESASEDAAKKPVKEIAVSETKVEMVPFSNVNLNYKNKRVITQLIRFIPDNLVELASTNDDPTKFIISNINDIPLNNIQQEFIKSSDGDDILQYPNHSDLYDIHNEGVFVGKGICFSNIKTDDKNIKDIIDSFVERVVRHGNSLATNLDVVEKPLIVQTGGQRFKLIYGHQRTTYLIYSYGLEHVYDFNLSKSSERQDLKILLENGTKTAESGYEQLLSYHFTVADLGLTNREEIMQNLSIQQSMYYAIIDFIQDKHLISIIKSSGINLSLKVLISAIAEVKKALKILNVTDKDELYDKFEEKLLVLSKKNKNVSIANPVINVKLPNDSNILETLLFTDIRKLKGFDIDDYNLTDPKSVRELFKKLSLVVNTK